MYKYLLIATINFFLNTKLCSQSQDTMSFENKLFNVTTFINTQHTINKEKILKQATGFYFAEMPDTLNKLKEARIWLISNRHVLLPDEIYPDTLYINFRRFNKRENRVMWSLAKINKDYIIKNIKSYNDKRIDVATLEITTIVHAYFSKHVDLIPIHVLTKENFLNKTDEYKPEVGDDILAIGYPKGFYDEYNTFPIVKTGIISSKFELPFNGLPYFLIDCKLFPGSSGSLVISKPKEVIISNGSPRFATGKYLLFLGLYSGDPFRVSQILDFDDMTITKKDIFDTGAVWYSELIKDLIGFK